LKAIKDTKLHVYLLAGIKTSESAFHTCRDRLQTSLSSMGMEPAIHILFPYGDSKRNVLKQIIEVRMDLSTRRRAGEIGGRKALNDIKKSLGGRRVLLLGHSGGGIAAYHAARYMKQEDMVDDFRIVQIGSPRMKISQELRDKISYFHSIDQQGMMNDPVTRIGSWGGWSWSKGKLPSWNDSKHAPGYVEGVSTVGGHADYFRHTEPFIDQESVCNLDKTMNRVDAWLSQWLAEEVSTIN